MGLLQLLWKRRWVLMVALVIVVGGAIPALLSIPSGFTSQGELFLPPMDPLELSLRDLSPIDILLQQYAGGELVADVSADLGDRARDLVSIDVNQPRSSQYFGVSVEARSPEVAADAVGLASKALIDEGAALAEQQVERLESEVIAEQEPLEVQQAALEAKRERLRSDINRLLDGPLTDELEAKQIELTHLESRITLIQGQIDNLAQLVQNARVVALSRSVGSTVTSGASAPKSTFRPQAIETLGLAVFVGLTGAALTIVWLERRSLLPVDSQGQPKSYGGWHRTASLAGDGNVSHPAPEAMKSEGDRT